MNWPLVQKLTRKKRLGIIRENENIENPKIIYNHKEKLNEGDKLIIWKSEYKNLSTKPSSSINIPIYNPKDNFFENIVSLVKKMIIFENEDFIVINKFPNISSQGGAKVKTNLYFLINHYLHSKYDRNFIEERNIKYN